MDALLSLLKAASAVTVALIFPTLFKRATLYLSTKHIPGPSYTGFVAGNLQECIDDEKAVVMNQWVEKYGKVIRIWGMLGSPDVFLADVKGISHVLKHDSVGYQKPDETRYLLERVTGHGIFVVEEDEHRKQRKVLNPAFGTAELRAITDIFFQKSLELRDAWAALIHCSNGLEKAELNATDWVSRLTLDIIGHAGFNYQINAISGRHNELNEAFLHMNEGGNFLTLPVVLKLMFPVLRALPEANKEFRRAQATLARVARELYDQSRAAVEEGGELQAGGRDLFSLLIRSNMKNDIPQAQRLSKEEVMAQVPTFLAAGHDTTSNSATLALYLLCTHPQVQSKLRTELLSVPTDSPSMEELNALPYLDAVVREALRVLGPVPTTVRVATKDDVIPLRDPFVDRYGRERDVLEVKKGQEFILPLIAINKDKSLWGEDAEEFKPERWENPLPEAVNAIPGVFSNMMTFLGGPHACIGWRFSVVETKAILFTLIRAFELELAVPQEDIMIKRGFAVHRAEVRGKEREGGMLPIVIRPVGI
ncbi:hypothetical protein V5O48_007173 [Marasmius crinis-equi]|uniref:Cytochrome P450 n=1 Tax=Marasmius crinis-equi TaxID=585013 RepID=A0ABR3FHW9_9AGAR